MEATGRTGLAPTNQPTWAPDIGWIGALVITSEYLLVGWPTGDAWHAFFGVEFWPCTNMPVLLLSQSHLHLSSRYKFALVASMHKLPIQQINKTQYAIGLVRHAENVVSC
jgi:hypothetical protein